MPHHMNTTDIMMLVGLGTIFLVIVYSGARVNKIMTVETPRTDAQGCQQTFNTIVAAGVLFVVLWVLTSVLH